MSGSPKNIWNKIEVIPQLRPKIKKLYRRSVKIKQIDKESNILAKEPKKQITPTLNTKNLFKSKKRGRKLKTNDINAEGTHSRLSDDNLKRKIKTHFHNYIIALLNNKLKAEFPNNTILKFGKISSNITQNITVEYNQVLFNKKIKDIIFEVSNKYQDKDMNLKCINYIMNNKETNKELITFLNMTYKELYINYYLKSTKKDFESEGVDESYEAHIKKLKKFGEKYIENYIKNALSLIDFYNNCKKRNRKNKKNLNLNDTSGINPDPLNEREDISYYIEDNKNNFKLLNFEKNIANNKISFGTQTDIKLTDDESEEDYI